MSWVVSELESYTVKIHGAGKRDQRAYPKKAGTFQTTYKEKQDILCITGTMGRHYNFELLSSSPLSTLLQDIPHNQDSGASKNRWNILWNASRGFRSPERWVKRKKCDQRKLGQNYETGWNKGKKCNQGRRPSIKSSWLRNASPTLQQITEQHIIMTMKRHSSSSQHPFISSLHFLAETYHRYFSSIPSSSLTNFSPQ